MPDEHGDRGAASVLPRSAPLTHFHATRLPELGDVVLSVTRELNPQSWAPASMELRAFRADAPRRATIPAMGPDDMLVTDGGLAYARVDLASTDADASPPLPARDRVAHLVDLRFAGITAHERSSHVGTGLAEWLRVTLETELLLASFARLEGLGSALRLPLGDEVPADDDEANEDFLEWGADWLAAHEYEVRRQQPRGFSKRLSPAEGGDR